MSKVIVQFDPDGCIASENACRDLQQKYREGFKEYPVGTKDGRLDRETFARFFAERVAEFDAGVVSRYDFPIWKTVGYVLSFDMEFVYSYYATEPGKPFDPERDIAGSSDVIPESDEQNEIRRLLKEYLIAAAALAKRIGSETYRAFRQHLIKFEFERPYGSPFKEYCQFNDFYDDLKTQLKFLWADNEIVRHILVSQNTPTHPQKQGQNQKK